MERAAAILWGGGGSKRHPFQLHPTDRSILSSGPNTDPHTPIGPHIGTHTKLKAEPSQVLEPSRELAHSELSRSLRRRSLRWRRRCSSSSYSMGCLLGCLLLCKQHILAHEVAYLLG